MYTAFDPKFVTPLLRQVSGVKVSAHGTASSVLHVDVAAVS